MGWPRSRLVRLNCEEKLERSWTREILLGLTLASPLMYTGVLGWSSARDSITAVRAARASTNLSSWPLVGRYRQMWALGDRPGMDRRRGRTAAEVVGRMVMKGSRAECHMHRVPPFALRLSNASSG